MVSVFLRCCVPIAGFLILTFAGCSGASSIAAMPDDISVSPLVDDSHLATRHSSSGRVLWGVWNISFDLEKLGATVEPLRNGDAHFNVTDMILPPACDDCVKIAVNSFDPVTRILDTDVTLRNPCKLAGHDVRGILYTNAYGHGLSNADDWTGLYDKPGGDAINPFRAFAKDSPQRLFAGEAEHSEKCLIYIPKPPHYAEITFAVEASFPGNCKEPYQITNFWQEAIQSGVGSSGNIYIDVCDWQNDVSEVTIEVPEITGDGLNQLTHQSGDIWTVELTNNEGAVAGIYNARITGISFGSAIPLHDFVAVTISSGGIADKYPGDDGIENDPAVIFVEQFEESTLGELFDNWEEAKNPGNMMFSSDSPSDCAGNQSIKVRHVGEQDTGAHLYRRLLPGYDELYVRFYVKFDPTAGRFIISFILAAIPFNSLAAGWCWC